ncbi:MAG: hypothetical protein UY80_C0036G0004 [Parcubacteria group bacterium GW2011_GWB1_53_43]|nr:MAG: hypothetical protein UY80_C0036G0004 [Parcubacteria group bacterium GW2011_GWB1_53_43]
MKYLYYFCIGLIALILIFLAYTKWASPQKESDTVRIWQTQTDEQANVTVAVTPVDLSPQVKEWKFDIVMNTHSVELGQNMAESTVLMDDSGKEYKPLRWEGAAPGGHHREVVLSFSRLTSAPKSIELKITGIADTIRTFTWQLEDK